MQTKMQVKAAQQMAANKRYGNISNQSENNPTSTESHPDIWSDSDNEQAQNDIEPSNGSNDEFNNNDDQKRSKLDQNDNAQSLQVEKDQRNTGNINPTALEVRIPKKGTKIIYKDRGGGEEEIQATVLGRAGKATSKNKYWYNIQNYDPSLESLNFVE